MSSSPDRLVYMANQIGKFFQSQGHDKTVPGVADHIKKFWDPRMRKQIFAHLDAGGAGLDLDVREALKALRDEIAGPAANPGSNAARNHP
jgi:formate dehydrogenase subunit delta